MTKDNFVKAEYKGHFLEHMKREFAALQWIGSDSHPSDTEKNIRDQVTHVMHYLVENWQNMEVAFHVCRTLNRLIEYKVLSALQGGPEFKAPLDTPHKQGDNRPCGSLVNERCPTVHKDYQTDQVLQIDERLTIWETGELVATGEGFRLNVKLPYAPIEDIDVCILDKNQVEGQEREVKEIYNKFFLPGDPQGETHTPEMRYKALQGGRK